ncbi:hypothetical protein [Agrococcus citreus]|uniref:ABC transporter n=1 Tax=Agrococcus citreus TaxID=84643 RepID=A0ABN1YTK9_9MICO
MSDEQPTSWRDRFFGSGPAQQPTPEAPETAPPTPSGSAAEDGSQHSAELAPDEAEVAATSVDEHDAHQPLVEHDTDETRVEHDADEPRVEHDADRAADSPIEPTVIAPSTLRGPSHSAAHPDDTVRSDVRPVQQDDAATSSLERADSTDDDAGSRADDAPTQAMPTEPPPLVEPRRPSFGLRRQGDAVRDAQDADAPASEGSGLALGGLAAAGAMGAAASTRRDAPEQREFVEPEPTQAIDQQRSDDSTQVIDYGAYTDDDTDTGTGTGTGAGDTRAMDAQEPPAAATAETKAQRFGIVRDDAQRSPSIPVDDETASATAAGGTPIVLVEEPEPPRRKGARGVGFAVALLATLIFAALFAAAFFAVGYLFDRAFDATETLQSVWLRPSYLLPVIVFFLAYWIVTLIVNRAGWWAHVLGAFIVALLVYVAHIGGAYMEAQGGWAGYTALPGIDAQALGQLLLAPLSVLAFVIAREVPVWVGGIVARRGRKAREWNRQSMDEFNAEHAERLAAYESARG